MGFLFYSLTRIFLSRTARFPISLGRRSRIPVRMAADTGTVGRAVPAVVPVLVASEVFLSFLPDGPG